MNSNTGSKAVPEVVHISRYDEELPGSDIVSHIEKHAKEIDEELFQMSVKTDC